MPEDYDLSDLYILGTEGDQSTSVHFYPLGHLDVTADGRVLLTTTVNGLQNEPLTLTRTHGSVPTGTAFDTDLTGDFTLQERVEIIDIVGVNNGRNGAMAGGTELSTAQFDGYRGSLGGASRSSDGSDTWVPNAYNSAGLDHDRATEARRGGFEVWGRSPVPKTIRCRSRGARTRSIILCPGSRSRTN